ncbi:MAG: hypothetical protein IPJ60_02530 [Sphingobacteriaceae bacterium]|nr:hypothetical protein [Sphingobacteriaceae bacterium]
MFYLKRDSVVNSVIHTIYVYSTNPDSAQYLVKFSNVGAGKGNYIQVASAANGRVYKWIAPINNILKEVLNL